MAFHIQLPLVIIALILVLMTTPASAQIGVCYGMVGDNLPSPVDVVAMYKANNIGKMRLYDPNPTVLEALRGSGIELLLGVSGTDLPSLATNATAAGNWVHTNVLKYLPDVNFRYIAVANEVIPGSYANYVVPALWNIYGAIKAAGQQDQIKVSVAIHSAVLGNSYPPSAGAFGQDLLQFLGPIVKFLSETGAPFLYNVYPFFAHIDNPSQVTLQYALFQEPGNNQVGYQNLFDAMVDAMYSAIERVDGGWNVDIVVSETGWPSYGGFDATIDFAASYNYNLIQHIKGGKGTPKRPGQTIETFIFAMFNENQKGGAPTEKYFGLFYPNKAPVYPLTF